MSMIVKCGTSRAYALAWFVTPKWRGVISVHEPKVRKKGKSKYQIIE